MKTFLSVTVPVRIWSESNKHDGWRDRAARVKEQKNIVTLMLRTARVVDRASMSPPYVVRLVRLAPQPIHDMDNLVSGMKASRDAVAAFLGVDDAEMAKSRAKAVTWLVDQEADPAYGLRIEIGKESAVDSKEFAL